MWEQRVVLIHDPQPPLPHGQAADVLAVKQDAAGLQGKRPDDRLEQHGLAGACLPPTMANISCGSIYNSSTRSEKLPQRATMSRISMPPPLIALPHIPR